jgi:hypothetical protein
MRFSGSFGFRCFLLLLAICAGMAATGQAQSRIRFNNQDLFLNGSNVAWVNFAGDLGPGALDTTRFKSMYDSIHAHGGNALRLWLHTNGTQTPAFDAGGRVTGPGTKSAAYLQKILDLAWQRKIGLILCLWSFDMQRASIGSTYTTRNALMLNDTSYARSYINNALIPLVTAVKGHPAIISWEVFNEAEGMSIDGTEYGWSDINDIAMANIQRFVNLVAGAIHTTDPGAKVTTGAWDLTAQTDVNPLPKPVDVHSVADQTSAAEARRIEENFAARYGVTMPAGKILSLYARANYNYYRDDRLVAAGGDSLGTLDFYTSHYYDNGQSTSLCPFLHPSADYGLTKPLVIAEFWPEGVLTVAYTDLYTLLYDNGYAGAMSWGWYAGGTGHNQTTLQKNTMTLLQDLFSRYPDQIEISPLSGTIYAFSAAPTVLDKGESSIIDWKTSLGTTATLNGNAVPIRGTLTVTPDSTTSYTLVANGTSSHTAQATVVVYPSGKIISFTSSATTIGSGERALLRWKVANGSTVTLNDSSVSRSDSLYVHPSSTTTYTLIGQGETRDTASIGITVKPVDLFNRATGRPITVAASSTNPLYANPQNAVDGDTTTQWVSGTGTSTKQTISCDLGQNVLINRIVVRWGNSFPNSYLLSLRPEGGLWEIARTVTGGHGGTESLDSVNKVAQYVLLRLGTATDAGFAIRELEIYGSQETASVEDSRAGIPDQFALLQNFPNPFNPTTVVSCQLPVASKVKLSVCDILGREVEILMDGTKDAGTHTVTWNAEGKASGVYLCRLQVVPSGEQSPPYSQTRKLVLLR